MYLEILLRERDGFIDLKLPVAEGLSLWLYACTYASFVTTTKVFSVLLDAGCNSQEVDANGMNALFHCVLNAFRPESSVELQALLYLLRLGIDIHATDKRGMTISDYVNDNQYTYECVLGSYRQDLWYCALVRGGFTVPPCTRSAKYTKYYTPRHYFALCNLESWHLVGAQAKANFDEEFVLTKEEYEILDRLEAGDDDYSGDIESSSSHSDDEMDDRLEDIDDGDETEDDDENHDRIDQENEEHRAEVPSPGVESNDDSSNELGEIFDDIERQ